MDRLKEVTGVQVMILNAVYWGFSEYYFYDGSFFNGLLIGSVVSILCATVGFCFGKFIGSSNK